MSRRQEQNTGTREVREALRFDVDRLHDYLEQHIGDYAGPLEVEQFRGGQSNPTYLLTTPSRRYVLRRKPPGKLLKSAHAVDREHRIMTALGATGFPVPETHLYCDDEDVIGTAFFVMAFVEGRIFWDLDLPNLGPDERAAIYDDVNATIAKLHGLDYEALGLGDYGKPGNYFERQIGRWSAQYRASETQSVPDMDALMDWLPANIPDDDSASIVHGDYRLDNMIIHADEPRVIAVLDWELSTIGHPLADFTYHLMTWQMPEIGIGSVGLAGKNLDSLGIPDEEAYTRAYCERTGRDGIENRHFYSAFNFFRLAAILQGIAGRVRDGTASSAHAHQAERAVAPLARLGWQYAKGNH